MNMQLTQRATLWWTHLTTMLRLCTLRRADALSGVVVFYCQRASQAYERHPTFCTAKMELMKAAYFHSKGQLDSRQCMEIDDRYLISSRSVEQILSLKKFRGHKLS